MARSIHTGRSYPMGLLREGNVTINFLSWVLHCDMLVFLCVLTSRKASLFMLCCLAFAGGCMDCISTPVSPLFFFFWRTMYNWYKSFVAAPGFSVMMLWATFWSNCTPRRWSVGSKREKLLSLAFETLGIKIVSIIRHWHWIKNKQEISEALSWSNIINYPMFFSIYHSSLKPLDHVNTLKFSTILSSTHLFLSNGETKTHFIHFSA